MGTAEKIGLVVTFLFTSSLHANINSSSWSTSPRSTTSLGSLVLLVGGAAVTATTGDTNSKSGTGARGQGALGHANDGTGFDVRGVVGDSWSDPSMEGFEAAGPLFDFDVLVTGYEPFLDYGVNPAHEVAVSLNETCDTVHLSHHPHTMRLCYEGVAVPVTPEGSSWTAQALQESPRRWDGIIHLGFESSAKGLKLETVAANVESSEEYGYMWNVGIPCEKEGTPFRYIHKGSPCILPTTAPVSYLNLQELTEILEDSGHGDLVSLETWSRDAGAYYCNDQFYRTLHAIRVDGSAASSGFTLIPAIFVHLPDVAVIGQDDMATMVRFVAQSIMLGTVGFLPESCR